MKHTYLISDKYCENWTVKEAMREVIANALDTKESVDIHWSNGFGYVKNSGSVLGINHLLLGESTKSEDEWAIGQFGEGFKIAALVLVREGREFFIYSGGRKFEFGMEMNEDFGKNVLTVDISEDEPSEGTCVKFTCAESELLRAKNLFRQFEDASEYQKGILDAAGKFYVCGVLISEGNDSLFGYDFPDKKMINRDRTVIDSTHIHGALQRSLASLSSVLAITKLLSTAAKEGSSFVEKNVGFYPGWSSHSVWTSVVTALYGEKVAIASSDSADNLRAEYIGYKILQFGDNLNYAVHYATQAPYARDVRPEGVKTTVPWKKLSGREKWCIRRAIRYFKESIDDNIDPSAIHVTEDLSNEALAQREGNCIYLNRNICDDFPTIYSSLCHEMAHAASGCPDCDAYFETTLTQFFARIAETKFSVKRRRRK